MIEEEINKEYVDLVRGTCVCSVGEKNDLFFSTVCDVVRLIGNGTPMELNRQLNN